jgi:hypothetical protein
MNQRAIVGILIALIVVLAGTTIYFATSKNTYAPSVGQPFPAQTQSMAGKIPTTTNQAVTNGQTTNANEAVNPKTYTNTKYKFSVNYPSNCFYTESSYKLGELPGGILFSVDFDKGSCASGEGAISINVAEILGDSLIGPNGMDPVSTKDLTISGKKAKNYDEEAYVVSDGKYRFEIIGTEKSLQTTLKTMVDSFKFTN